ncbi:MAG: hypothetical protein ACAH59_04005 [Pseudobdellovibrionaceae bacterium]
MKITTASSLTLILTALSFSFPALAKSKIIHCVSSDTYVVSDPSEVNRYDFEYELNLTKKTLKLFVNKGEARVLYTEATGTQRFDGSINGMQFHSAQSDFEGHPVQIEALYEGSVEASTNGKGLGQLRIQNFWDLAIDEAVNVRRMMKCSLQ